MYYSIKLLIEGLINLSCILWKRISRNESKLIKNNNELKQKNTKKKTHTHKKKKHKKKINVTHWTGFNSFSLKSDPNCFAALSGSDDIPLRVISDWPFNEPMESLLPKWCET